MRPFPVFAGAGGVWSFFLPARSGAGKINASASKLNAATPDFTRRSESGLRFDMSITSRPYVRKVQSIGVAGFAEIHIILLVFHQHPRLIPRVRLMASETVHRE
jgi:hypothetical protein